jgi:hypothetical protein
MRRREDRIERKAGLPQPMTGGSVMRGRRTIRMALWIAFASCAAAQAQPPQLKLFADRPARHSAAMPTVEHFPASRRVQSMLVILDPAHAGTPVDVRVMRVSQEPPASVHAARDRVGETGWVVLSLTSATDWPAGTYAVEVRAGERVLARLTYRVVAD